MVSSKRRSYTKEQRAAVLADVKATSVSEAARKHEVPQTTVSNWIARAPRRVDAAEPPKLGPTPPSPGVPRERSARTLRGRVAKVYSPSQKAVVLEDAAKDGVTAAAKKHGMSRFSIYDWQRRLTKAAAGEWPSPTSGPAPKDIEQQRDAEILEEWKNHPGLGPSQIVNQLRRKSIKVSVHTTRRVMEDAGYRPPKVVRQKHDRRYEAVRPNVL
jgi:transposase